MRFRRLLAVFALVALVAKLVSPCEATASASVGGPNAQIAKCHLAAMASPLAQGDSEQAPSGGVDHDGCCDLCQIGWSTLPVADNLFTIGGLEYHLAPRAPPAPALVTIRLNRSAPTRGPPSFI
ncbi:MAG TPA: DUF2946 family protein [Methylocystis sp.]|jgi:hypothetical protein